MAKAKAQVGATSHCPVLLSPAPGAGKSCYFRAHVSPPPPHLQGCCLLSLPKLSSGDPLTSIMSFQNLNREGKCLADNFCSGPCHKLPWARRTELLLERGKRGGNARRKTESVVSSDIPALCNQQHSLGATKIIPPPHQGKGKGWGRAYSPGQE